MKKINSKWYSIEKIKYEKHQYHYIKDPNGYLYVDSQYNTKITADDLPDWFVYGRFYKRFGYLSAKGVVDLYYIPNMWNNHMFKDDELVISYEEKIDKTNDHLFGDWAPDQTNDNKHTRECKCGEKEIGDCTFDNGVIFSIF